jgi:hypothetical protein
MAGVLEDEWPDVVFDDSVPYEEYNRLVEAVGELTSAVLDCQAKGLLVPSTNQTLRSFLSSLLENLEILEKMNHD